MLEKIKGGLIVSCQALENEPLHSSFIMGKLALAAKEGGACGIRANSKEDILEIAKNVDLPIIGIVKRDYIDSDIYITPTIKEINELLETRCEIIALDATNRSRPNKENIKDLVDYIHLNNRLAMADCSTLKECLEAEKLGFDIVSTTLAGYTPYSIKKESVDFELIENVLKEIHVPLIAEGKINTPEELKKVYELGVFSAVVGSAITRPQLITKKFTKVLNNI